LRDTGVTVILTTHYIEEAEEMADRIGVITKGRLILVENKTELMHKLGKKQLTLQLQQPLTVLPVSLAAHALERAADGLSLTYTYDTRSGTGSGISSLLHDLGEAGIAYKDLQTSQSSLEDIFVSLVHQP